MAHSGYILPLHANQEAMTSPRLTERSKLEISGFKVGESELARGQVAQRTVRPEFVVILLPAFDFVTLGKGPVP